MKVGLNSLGTQTSLTIGDTTYQYFSLQKAQRDHFPLLHQLPYSLKVLFENLLRFEDGTTVKPQDLHALAAWVHTKKSDHEIAFRPARVLCQDFTGVPAVVDLAAMRSAVAAFGKNPADISPLSPVDLVIDHSIMVDQFATANAMEMNTAIEMERNIERYEFLRWGQTAFSNFQVVPPGTGICHQVNLEYLAKTVWTTNIDEIHYAYPDTLVGTDSHTTMINALGVLGWGVGGIEAEAAMLGQPVSMLIPQVIGCKLTGHLREGITATDLVLNITHTLRKKGVVGKFVEFYGPGLAHLTLADRATIANMAPEYGATCGFFPVDQETIRYLELTGRSSHTLELVETYAKIQGLWYDVDASDPVFTDTVTFDLSTIQPALAGPKRPQDQVSLEGLCAAFDNLLDASNKTSELNRDFAVDHADYALHHGHVVIAAITSCTNTSNPSVLMSAGLLAKNALAKGLRTKPWVKTSLAPGSKVVTDYLNVAGLQTSLNDLGFSLVGYGCTTCIGNSGPLPAPVAQSVTDHDVMVCAVLSGNRNFEGRVHPQVQANWLASPPLVVALALAGTVRINLHQDPLGFDTEGQAVYLKDIWPSNHDVAMEVAKLNKTMFRREYAQVFLGDAQWQAMQANSSTTYTWNPDSTYIQHPPFFKDLAPTPAPVQSIHKAAILALLGDSITTDHISPAGSIKENSPAGLYLKSKGVAPVDFNSYGSRRGNHEVMMRGTFANIRLRNEMTPEIEGGYTRHYPSNTIMPIFDAAMLYQQENQSLVVIAGQEYGTGSSRDWAAKGTLLLGVKAVITESFERIHRSNLIGMGVLPLQFKDNDTRKTLNLTGREHMSLCIDDNLAPGVDIMMTIHQDQGPDRCIPLLCRIDTENELEYYRHGGILHYVLRQRMFCATI